MADLQERCRERGRHATRPHRARLGAAASCLARRRPHADYPDRASERADLLRAVSTIEDVTGERPRGFLCRGSLSAHTRALLAEMAFACDSNASDDYLPHRDAATPGGPVLILPYTLDANNMKFFHPNGFAQPRGTSRGTRTRLWRSCWREGERGAPKLLSVGSHLRICGRPARFRAVEAILARLAELGPKAWIARRIGIAERARARPRARLPSPRPKRRPPPLEDPVPHGS